MSNPTVRFCTRIALLGVITGVLQITTVSQIPLLEVNGDISPLVVVSVGLLLGPVSGVVTGFAIGLLLDVALLQTLGVSSLILLILGYMAGRVRDMRDPDPASALPPLLAGSVATLLATLGFALMQVLLGADAPTVWVLLRETVASVLVGALLALPVYAATRRVLKPCLPDDPRRRRRRAYATGSLSPLIDRKRF